LPFPIGNQYSILIPFKVKENELKEARTLIATSTKTTEKKKPMQNPRNAIMPKDEAIEKLQSTITRRTRTFKSSPPPSPRGTRLLRK
jgi:hypothetical protein